MLCCWCWRWWCGRPHGITHPSVTPPRPTLPHAPPHHDPTPQDDPSLVEAAVADLQAVVERDPACDTHVQPLWFFKGFQVSGVWEGKASAEGLGMGRLWEDMECN